MGCALRPCARRRPGIAAMTPKDPERQRITRMRDFYDFLLNEIPALAEPCHRRQGVTRGGPTSAPGCARRDAARA